MSNITTFIRTIVIVRLLNLFRVIIKQTMTFFTWWRACKTSFPIRTTIITHFFTSASNNLQKVTRTRFLIGTNEPLVPNPTVLVLNPFHLKPSILQFDGTHEVHGSMQPLEMVVAVMGWFLRDLFWPFHHIFFLWLVAVGQMANTSFWRNEYKHCRFP